MAIYLIKGEIEGSWPRKIMFSNSEVNTVLEFVSQLPNVYYYKKCAYSGPNGFYIASGKEHVQVQEATKEILAELVRILDPKYFIEDSKPGKQPISKDLRPKGRRV